MMLGVKIALHALDLTSHFMRLEEALVLSKVEASLDGEGCGNLKEHYSGWVDRPAAVRSYRKTRGTSGWWDEKIIVAFSTSDFAIAWKDSLRVITRNPSHYDRNFSQQIQGWDDWQPLCS